MTMTQVTTKQRVEFIDLAKGICILLIVLNHSFARFSGSFLDSFMIFRMPLYFVLSGLFFKTYGSLALFIKKKINKLIVPMCFAFVFISIPSTFLLNMKEGIPTTINNLFLMPTEPHKLNFGLSPSSWFLLCLFILNIYFCLGYYITKANTLCLAVLSLICGVVGCYLGARDIILPIWLDTALTAMPFFCMGFVLRNYTHIVEDKYSIMHILLFILSIFTFCVTASYLGEDETILYVGNHYDLNPLLLYLGGFSGTLCVLLLAKLLNYLPIVSYIGRYSIVVLLTHQLYLFIIWNILYHLKIVQDNLFVNCCVFTCIILVSLPTIKYGTKYLPFCFAQKDLIK